MQDLIKGRKGSWAPQKDTVSYLQYDRGFSWVMLPVAMEPYKSTEITPWSEKAGSIKMNHNYHPFIILQKRTNCWLVNNRGFQTALTGLAEDKPRYCIRLFSPANEPKVCYHLLPCVCVQKCRQCVASVTAEQIINNYKLYSQVHQSQMKDGRCYKVIPTQWRVICYLLSKPCNHAMCMMCSPNHRSGGIQYMTHRTHRTYETHDTWEGLSL